MILTDEVRMKFGKHKGKRMVDIPASYLNWFALECNPETASDDAMDVLDYIERNRDIIDYELVRD